MREIPILSIIVPCFNEDSVLIGTADSLLAVLRQLKNKGVISKGSFILFVDDGSKDKTWDIIESISFQHDAVFGIKLSRNTGHQNALLAGMEEVQDKCDCLVSIDADLQQDENKIGEFVQKYLEGAEVVLGIRNDRKTDSFFKKVTALSFYWFMKIMGVEIVKNHADYRLLSNRANKSIMEFKEVNLFLRGLVPLLGFRTDYVFFDVSDRCGGSSKYTVSKMVSFAIDGITSFSVKPLRIISLIGFFQTCPK
jgi:glycosyltransferase involved in cell wall biosynthesis